VSPVTWAIRPDEVGRVGVRAVALVPVHEGVDVVAEVVQTGGEIADDRQRGVAVLGADALPASELRSPRPPVIDAD